MAKAFPEVKFIAPDQRDVFSAPKGHPEQGREVGPRKAKYGNENSDMKRDGHGVEKPHEMTNEQGNWNVYNKDGGISEQYDGNWTPKGDPGMIDNMMHKNSEVNIPTPSSSSCGRP